MRTRWGCDRKGWLSLLLKAAGVHARRSEVTSLVVTNKVVALADSEKQKQRQKQGRKARRVLPGLSSVAGSEGGSHCHTPASTQQPFMPFRRKAVGRDVVGMVDREGGLPWLYFLSMPQKGCVGVY